MAIQEHLLCYNYSPSFEGFSILTRENNDFKLKIMQSLPIACDNPILNKADSSLLLEVFSCNIRCYRLMFFTHMMSIYPIVCMQLLFEFCILSKRECKSIYYLLRVFNCVVLYFFLFFFFLSCLKQVIIHNEKKKSS